jgi:hypothetical protein
MEDTCKAVPRSSNKVLSDSRYVDAYIMHQRHRCLSLPVWGFGASTGIKTQIDAVLALPVLLKATVPYDGPR